MGVNRFTDPAVTCPREEKAALADQTLDDTVERTQIERLRAVRARRDPQRWQAALDRVTEHARSTGNLMPAILEAVESLATVGEIADAVREVFGEHRPR